jgi:transketolase
MLNKVAKIIRGLSVDAIEKANSGHPGLPLGCAEIGSVLFAEIMKYDPKDPDWPNRDRFILSAGHGSVLLYVLLHLSGYEVTLEDIQNFRQIGSKTPGHPEYGYTPGVETTSGPLGQGLANGVGMALAEKMMAEKFNTDKYNIVDHYTYVLASDGCMMEGITSEAASLAGHWGLEKLVVIYDQNRISLASKTDLTFTESVADRYRAYNWQVIENVNGHDIDEVRAALMKSREKNNNKPILIMARTHIGCGAPTKQDSYTAHGAPLGKEEVEGLKKNIGLPLDELFYISDDVKTFFKQKEAELRKSREKWEEDFVSWSGEFPEKKKEWEEGIYLQVPDKFDFSDINFDENIATRSASGKILNKVAEKIPYIIGGSADLSPSTKTYLNELPEVQKGSFNGRNIRFGVREHAMGAICNGISLHKGLRPYCSTFLIFSDYMRPTIRLAAMMNLPVVYIFTHDSIYVGEDGPTHQPIEQLESLRIIPNLKVIRPADSEEVKAAWQVTLERKEGPTALILSRQNLPRLRESLSMNDFRKGGYVVFDDNTNPDVVISASGSEVSTALQVKDLLIRNNITCRVVSVPDLEAFASQDKSYREEVLNSVNNSIQVVIEAATGQSWYEVIPTLSLGIFIRRFGESGPGNEVARNLGFDAEKISNKIIEKISLKNKQGK